MIKTVRTEAVMRRVMGLSLHVHCYTEMSDVQCVSWDRRKRLILRNGFSPVRQGIANEFSLPLRHSEAVSVQHRDFSLRPTPTTTSPYPVTQYSRRQRPPVRRFVRRSRRRRGRHAGGKQTSTHTHTHSRSAHGSRPTAGGVSRHSSPVVQSVNRSSACAHDSPLAAASTLVGSCGASTYSAPTQLRLWGHLLYPPSERSELARYHVMLFPVLPSFRAHSVFRCKYLENGLR